MGGWAIRDERNPLMGKAPSIERVDVYFLGTTVISTAIWLALPPTWRTVYGVSVAGFQTRTIAINVHNGLGLCGLDG